MKNSFNKILVVCVITTLAGASVIPSTESEPTLIPFVFIGLNSDGETVPGCPIDNEFVPIGEFVQLEGCAAKQCIVHEDGQLSVAEIQCPEPQNELGEGCERLPRPQTSYPSCCVDIVKCIVVKEIVYPVVYTANNITLLDTEDREHILQMAEALKKVDEKLSAFGNEVEKNQLKMFPEKDFDDDEGKAKFIHSKLYK